MTIFVTVILGMILVILGLSADWPMWAWPTMAALLLVVGVVTHRILAPAPEAFPRALLAEPELPEPVRQEQRIAHVALPSSVPDYDFSFTATVRWLVLDAPEDAPFVNPAGLAVDAVLQRARVVTAQQPPHRSAFTQHQLDGALATMRTDATGRVMAMAQDVALSLPEPDRERLIKLAGVRKDEDVWEHERNYERNKRAYLGEDVLKDTGSAVVWWLSRNEAEVEAAVDRIGLLAQLSAAANNDEVAPQFAHLVSGPGTAYTNGAAPEHAQHDWQQPFDPGHPPSENGTKPDPSLDTFLAWFGFSSDDPDVVLFTERLAHLARAHGKSAVADEIRRRFGDDHPEPGDSHGEDRSESPDG
ncbi:hypothetical protein [Streptomyces sp. YU58]|uniref:hypothetical protein n=1 Tax=Streptomyces sp. SX92 TaxID=3158972 RepID=UPI0027BAE49F|nr:hypothetical protein [Streptomyces coralus]WLW56497.1 hypothetical protein QU709_36355 [Streptomyces coralus]